MKNIIIINIIITNSNIFGGYCDFNYNIILSFLNKWIKMTTRRL